MDIKVNSIELVYLLAGIHNMFNDLTPTMFEKFVRGETENEKMLVRQQVLKGRIIELLEKGLNTKLDLYKGTTPFNWDPNIICEKLKLNPDRRKKK